jgi:hypothetical protein
MAHTETDKQKSDEALTEYTLWLMAFTGVLAVATIGLGAATVGLYLTGEKQVDLTRRALIGDQRAWLVTALEVGPQGLRIRDGFMTLDARLRISNVGRSPALDAHTYMALSTDALDTAASVAKLAAEHRTVSTHGLFVSPGDFYYRPWAPSTDDYDAPPYFSAIVAGCVTYKIMQDDELHQVAFAYQIGRRDGDAPWGSGLPRDGDLGADELVISPWTGGFAT